MSNSNSETSAPSISITPLPAGESVAASPAGETRAVQVRLRVKRRAMVRLALGALIVLLAFLARFANLNWDEHKLLHPDERYISVVTGQMGLASDIPDFFNPDTSKLNPFNTSWGRTYVYGTLPLFIVKYGADWLDGGCGPQPSQLAKLAGRALIGDKVEACAPKSFSGAYTHLVGRAWSAVADTIAVLLVMLLTARLFGWRAGLLAGAFAAGTVSLIQQSHFYTVDITTALASTLTLYMCVRLITLRQSDARAESSAAPRRLSLPGGMEIGLRMARNPFGDGTRLLIAAVLTGLATGLALSAKASSWQLIVVVVASVLMWLFRQRRPGFRPVVLAAAALVLAGAFTFVSFRIGQPYAFVGGGDKAWQQTVQDCGKLAPNAGLFLRVCNATSALPEPLRGVFAFNGQWARLLDEAEKTVTGDQDLPSGQQWANRTDFLFTFVNVVFWSAGVPLSLAALAGLGFMIGRLLKGRRYWAYWLPVVWLLANFLYFGSIPVKTMRYLAPFYPFIGVAAAVGLTALWRAGKPGRWPRFPALGRAAAAAAIMATLAGTVAWAVAYLQVITQPITRLEATRWIYRTVPTALGVTWSPSNGVSGTMLPVKTIQVAQGRPQSISFRLMGVDVGTPDATSGAVRDAVFTIYRASGAGEVVATLNDGAVDIGTARGSLTDGRIELAFGSVSLSVGREYRITLDTPSAGGRLSARTSTIAPEHWDDAVPVGIDGKGFEAYYNSLKSSNDGQIQNFAPDDPAKLQLMLSWIDEADYLAMSSNRLYGATARLPWKFPATSEWYRAIFAGELGFKLVGDFHRFMQLGPFTFNDQEMAQPLARPATTAGPALGLTVPYPVAEEAFSVYDHPRVLVFEKTPAYSRSLAEKVLGQFDTTRTVRQTPNKAETSPRGLLLDETLREQQREGGTWSEIFPRSSPLNQSQPLAVIAWLALLEMLGVAAFVILSRALARPGAPPALADAGYAASKILGVVLVALPVWWLGWLKLAEFRATTIWLVAAAIAAVAALLAWRNRVELAGVFRSHWRVIAAVEVVFLLSFVAWLLVRAANPDLWHPVMGGEKPMDFAYLNGILRSTYFPPIDPWFAQGYINYYYLGFVLVGAQIKALGIDPAVGYNLAIPTLFALVAVGGFGVSATLYRALKRGRAGPRGLIIAGVLGAIFLVGIGNGDEIRVVLPAWQRLGGIERGEPGLSAAVSGFGKWMSGAELPVRPEWPYWNPTRLGKEVPIAEFPLFTFLYSDLHAHMMSMPVTLLCALLALGIAAGARRWAGVLIAGAVVGSVWAINTWDYPIYLVLVGAAILARVRAVGGGWRDLVQRDLPQLAAFALATRVAIIPFTEHFGSAYTNVTRWTEDTTPLVYFITIYGTFLIPLGLWLAWRVWRGWGGRGLVSWLAAGTLGAIALATQKVAIGALAAPLTLLALAVALRPAGREPRAGDDRWRTQTSIGACMIAGAGALTLFVELFVLSGDIGRMNTVFKFYIQCWLLLGTAAAAAATWIASQLTAFITETAASQARGRGVSMRLSESVRINDAAALAQAARTGFGAVMGLALALALLYPAIAIPAKTGDRWIKTAPTGLDGSAYMPLAERAEGPDGSTPPVMKLAHDYEVIRWLQDNVSGSPVIMEGTTGGWGYRWGNRFSIYTGLPSVVGWEWHQRQQRTALSDQVVFDRQKDVADFYNTPDSNRALMLLRRFDVGYVIVGQLERSYYAPSGFAKFEQMARDGYLEPVFQNPGTAVYRVNRDRLF